MISGVLRADGDQFKSPVFGERGVVWCVVYNGEGILARIGQWRGGEFAIEMNDGIIIYFRRGGLYPALTGVPDLATGRSTEGEVFDQRRMDVIEDAVYNAICEGRDEPPDRLAVVLPSCSRKPLFEVVFREGDTVTLRGHSLPSPNQNFDGPALELECGTLCHGTVEDVLSRRGSWRFRDEINALVVGATMSAIANFLIVLLFR